MKKTSISITSLLFAILVSCAVTACRTQVASGDEQHPEIKCSSLQLDITIKKRKANGKRWDRRPFEEPDPKGMLWVMNGGKILKGERIAQREDLYKFRASFFSKEGITLKPSYTVRVKLVDADLGGDDKVQFDGWNSGDDRIGMAETTIDDPSVFSGSAGRFKFEARCVTR